MQIKTSIMKLLFKMVNFFLSKVSNAFVLENMNKIEITRLPIRVMVEW